jgi:hypothetical protein
METVKIAARDLRVGDIVHSVIGNSRFDVSNVHVSDVSVAVQWFGIPGMGRTFQPDTELTVERAQ